MDKLINYGKVIYNAENSELMIVNWYKYNVTSSRNTHICINKELKKVKTKSFIARFYQCCNKENINLDTIFEGIEVELAQGSEAINPSTEETVDVSTEKNLSMKKIKATFDNNIHIATFMEIQELESWLEDLGEELILLAINEAVKNNVRNIRYINTLLIDWRNQGFKTSSEVLYYLKNRKKKFNKSEPFEAANVGAYRVVEVEE